MKILVLNYGLLLHEVAFENLTLGLHFYLVNQLRVICSGLLALKNKQIFMTIHNNHIQEVLLRNELL